jgi:polar amino acid transport system substrate-binding protein
MSSRWLGGLALLVLSVHAGAWGQGSDRPLRVGTKLAPPFVIEEDGRLGGISMVLWQALAEDLSLTYTLQRRDLDGLLTGLEDGTLDLVVAAVTVTAERESRLDFTHPFHTTGLAIAVPLRPSATWAGLLHQALSSRFVYLLGGLTALLLVTGALIWWVERHHNQQFSGRALRGIGAGFWWSAVTMTTVGYGDKAPVTLPGRLLAVVWMFAGVVLISSFTAAIASVFTVGQLAGGISGPQDLRRHLSGTVESSTSATYLDRNGLRRRTYPDGEAALEALVQGEVDAVVYDAPILRYLASKGHGRAVRVLPGTFMRQDYAIALPSGSLLREPLNRALLRHVLGDEWKQTLERYLGR